MKSKTRILIPVLLVVLALLLAGAACAEGGILPVLQTPPPEETYAISLQQVTGIEYKNLGQAEGGGYMYNYENVSYACYSRFSTKLAEEGYMLVSSETLEDGTSRAVVTDGIVTLVIDYNLEKKTASVSYPPSVFARDAELYADYTEVKDGDVIQVTDHATAEVAGWQPLYRVQLYNSGNNYYSENGVNYAVVKFMVDYFRPESICYGNYLRKPVVRYEDEEITPSGSLRAAAGTFSDGYYINDSTSSYYFTGKQDDVAYAIVFPLTDEQMEHPEKVTVSFADNDNAVRYVYRLYRNVDEDIPGTWKGRAVCDTEGIPYFDMTLRITSGGLANYYAFEEEEGYKSPGSTNYINMDYTEKTIRISSISGGQDEATGTFAFEDGVLKMELKVKRNSDAWRDYTVELQKEDE